MDEDLVLVEQAENTQKVEDHGRNDLVEDTVNNRKNVYATLEIQNQWENVTKEDMKALSCNS